MTAVRVLACEWCGTEPAVVHDAQRDMVMCEACCCPWCWSGGSDGCTHCAAFVGAIPDRYFTDPNQPTILVDN